MAVKKAAPQPLITVTNDFSLSPYKFNGPIRPIWCAEHHFTGPWPCDCPPGPQIILMNPSYPRPGWPDGLRPDVITTGGARGGSKTFSLLTVAAFRGNPERVQKARLAGKPVDPVDLMYIAHPNYRGLILRPQATDLEDLLTRAEEMYGPTGAVITKGSPPMAEWPRSGAKIIFGHFLDDGWKKYVGPEYHFIGIDQIEMMPFEETFHRIVGSCRSTRPQLRELVLSTFNPGGGDDMKGAPGQGWLMDYFYIPAYLDGQVPRFGAVRDEQKKIRMFVPSKVQDNPYFLFQAPELNDTKDGIFCVSCKGDVAVPMAARPPEKTNVCPLCAGKLLNDGNYLKWLNGIQPESLRRAWRDGDMRALSGMFFRDFRPNGPLPGEPEHACHVYDPAKTRVEPWWHTWGSIDWGYIHPTDIQFHRKSPWGQIFTFKEISLKRVEPHELGVLIGRECAPILEALELNGPGKHITMYLSPDAYSKNESEFSTAHQISSGIQKILGKGSVFLADMTDDERSMRDPEQALLSMQDRRREQKNTQVTLVKASTDRVAGWMHMQTMLRFTSLHEESMPDAEFADNLYLKGGLVAYQAYMNQPEFSAKREVLPRWQISAQCRELLSCIPKAMHKPGTNDILKFDATESKDGDDPIDCARYGTFSEEMQGTNFPPLEQRVAEYMEELQVRMPGLSEHSKIMAYDTARRRELSKGKNKSPAPAYAGNNRFAVRRAMMQQQNAGQIQ